MKISPIVKAKHPAGRYISIIDDITGENLSKKYPTLMRYNNLTKEAAYVEFVDGKIPEPVVEIEISLPNSHIEFNYNE